ncbi:uncharacterized protein LOC117895984 [Drosophila subobscura]|uniref:uncharacterized protein LOC117895984 n=1 Tax=Drosophila subobscura TaxID=7241 RepID=UPI00155A9ABD|nr:uncharacterized protein LOC117895984 [Drosophila subobscura]
MNKQTAPEWVNKQLFVGLLEQTHDDFKAITNFATKAAISEGENYLTIVLRIQIGMQLKDDSEKEVSYILKIPLVNESGDDHEFHDLFIAEFQMYDRVIPELEALYAKNTSIAPSFKPLHLKFPAMTTKCDYILLEDLRTRGYRNAERTVGLDQLEVEAVLKKLAQWHAASAKRVTDLGEYEQGLRESYFTPEHLKLIEGFNMSFTVPFLECMQKYDLDPGQLLLISDYTSRLTDLYMEFGANDPQELNVLNHGDFWCNNFMFKYTDSGQVEDVCFVDFQLPKYGTPAQDLFCLLMTSPKFDIKLGKFDYFIEYYHRQLVEHLALLKYNQNAPTLSQLRANLRKNSLWAFICAQRMLPIVLMPPDEGSNIGNVMGDSEEASAFKRKMFQSPAYVQQIKTILPWLIERSFIR